MREQERPPLDAHQATAGRGRCDPALGSSVPAHLDVKGLAGMIVGREESTPGPSERGSRRKR